MPRLPAIIFALAATSLASAAPPAPLAMALQELRDQKSYSWETINLDPGPVALEVPTRRGRVTTVQISSLPDMKGSIDLNGDVLLVRQWPDGLRLETFLGANGAMLTNTPEGWMTNQEILTAVSDERLRSDTATPRLVWLRRADRPEIKRPDEELLPLLSGDTKFEETAPDTYVARGRSGGSGRGDDVDRTTSYAVTITMNLHNGLIRDYEVLIEGTRRTGRSHVAIPVTEHRSVVIRYVAMARVNLPSEARARLQPVHIRPYAQP